MLSSKHLESTYFKIHLMFKETTALTVKKRRIFSVLEDEVTIMISCVFLEYHRVLEWFGLNDLRGHLVPAPLSWVRVHLPVVQVA